MDGDFPALPMLEHERWLGNTLRVSKGPVVADDLLTLCSEETNIVTVRCRNRRHHGRRN